MEYVDEKYDQAKQILNSPTYFKKLFYRYGSDIEMITERAYEYWNKTKNSEYSWLKAEIWFAIRYEFCRTADDFILYRTENWMKGNYKKAAEIEQIFSELSE
jgi:glycerol-3-phosphate dehydrogenase